ncbi:hypothetical protein HBI80_000340 [Parastagonospora nodorum]|nr:hypothetical protein HBI80_000340 [Parastagonospora nodorum]
MGWQCIVAGCYKAGDPKCHAQTNVSRHYPPLAARSSRSDWNLCSMLILGDEVTNLQISESMTPFEDHSPAKSPWLDLEVVSYRVLDLALMQIRAEQRYVDMICVDLRAAGSQRC